MTDGVVISNHKSALEDSLTPSTRIGEQYTKAEVENLINLTRRDNPFDSPSDVTGVEYPYDSPSDHRDVQRYGELCLLLLDAYAKWTDRQTT